MPRSLTGVAALLLLTGCGVRSPSLVPPPQGAEGISLLGDTLWMVRLPPAEGRARVAQLVDAQRRAQARPGDFRATALLARRTAAVGRLREAVAIYNAAIAGAPTDASLRRRRAELILLLRHLDLAARELKGAAAGAALIAREFTEGADGQLAASGLRHGALHLLGITHFIRGDDRRAVTELRGALAAATDADEAAATAIWLLFALSRARMGRETTELLQAVRSDLPVANRRAELRLLLAFRGDLPLDSLRADLVEAAGREAESLYLYGLAHGHLLRGRDQEAKEALEQVRQLGEWSTLPYLAAEADLARLAHPCPGALPNLARDRRWDRCLLAKRTPKRP